MEDIRSRINGKAGSGPLGTFEAHISWLAQPAQASAFPARSESVPGQCSGAFEGIEDGPARGIPSGNATEIIEVCE